MALRAAIDPLGAAQAKLNQELAEYAALARRGAITSAEQAAAQVLARQRFDQTAQAIRGMGGASRLTRNHFRMRKLLTKLHDAGLLKEEVQGSLSRLLIESWAP